MKVVVGLGNPGAKYVGTRHNVGFEVIDYLAGGPGVGPFRQQFQAMIAEATEGGEKVLLVKPETFMNLSGRAVRAVADFYKVPLENLLIISDDFNLPLGKLRVRANGSHGGQNGLRNIQEQLGTDAYPRMRIGVGQPDAGEAVDFVLSRFKPGERVAVEDAVAKAANGVLLWLRKGLEACMNTANAGEKKAKESKERVQKNEKKLKDADTKPAADEKL
ncbi:aminoacyl-tRNA hydrolase [Limnoglobus roseus]|uniref:Peptidyl-tRNA hydrolase n=1 Tax=Limnoglobus roseus TaxID=2598579 RepID=A0A5C1ADX2_9BACT|nr:aminoacyl-tRNA hydrolase [Limnoglobus roseus]QEL15268.1 aminoacyl-tRNA hydrolase [Limnoglobus roseus]